MSDRTWNPITGCTKVSPGCDHCYIERTPERYSPRCKSCHLAQDRVRDEKGRLASKGGDARMTTHGRIIDTFAGPG